MMENEEKRRVFLQRLKHATLVEMVLDLEEEIRSIQTIDAEPVRRGKWLEHPFDREWDMCSVCRTGVKRREYGPNGDGTEWVTEVSYQRCPWCGARMDGES